MEKALASRVSILTFRMPGQWGIRISGKSLRSQKQRNSGHQDNKVQKGAHAAGPELNKYLDAHQVERY